ncbi:MAG: GxxExxY protein [Lamprobacter sp.]|uniref:GxxExxY protein n=1 Tax=Lamprobacter sp. TaxID=3100796 RepID=UPI002B25FC29|nr:GxxExxY protein [Lamprobacter sp.]MEA3643219.1 GxxExxY protein [Lamprobacter sp.]
MPLSPAPAPEGLPFATDVHGWTRITSGSEKGIWGRVLLELKACRALAPAHEAQLLNYLRATGIKAGLLINFGQPRAQIKRFVL